MLDKDTIVVIGKTEFDKQVKELFVNMTSNVRTLHKTNFKSCPYSKMSNRFITFSNMKEVDAYERTHKDATPFKRCGNCFR